MATKKPMKKPVKRVRRFQEGGEADLKAEGLAASNKDAPLGFFESLRRLGQGNIDQEGSEAYKRYGAGRGRMERAAASEFPSNAGNGATTRALAPVSAKGLETYNKTMDSVDAEAGDSARMSEMLDRGRAEGERDYKKMAPSLAQTQVAALLADKPSAKPKPAAKSSAMTSRPATGSGGGRGAAAGEEDAYRASRAASTAPAAASAAAPTASRNDASATPTQSVSAPSESKFDASDALGLGLAAASVIPVVRGGRVLYQAGKKMYQTYKAAKDAIKNRPKLDRPGTVSGEGFVMRDVKDPSAVAKAPQKALPAPRKGDITDVTPKNVNPRSVTGSAREDAKADRFRRGLDELSAKQMAEKNLRERGNKFLFADDAMKRGGRVKKMASGGSVKSSTASKRGDGIALRGKTRGKIY